MAGFFSRVKTQMREREVAQQILDMPIEDRPIVVYAEDDYTWNQLGPYVEAVGTSGSTPIVYVTSDGDDPVLEAALPYVSAFAISDSIAAFLPRIDSPVFLTTMPDLDQLHVKRPRDANVVYAFHSLNSIHMAYRDHAFDAYDAFFCTGPHHKQELTAYFASIGKTDAELYEVGYPKLDSIAKRFGSYAKRHTDGTTVIIAPSWGEQNLLAMHGSTIVGALAGAGHRVVVRPHPAFFESIYPEGATVVADLEREFSGNELVQFERSITSEDSFMEADIMISDWSGAAFEYSLGTERPVVFIDLPPKVKNPNWSDLGREPFESRMRDVVGEVVSPGRVGDVADVVGGFVSTAADHRERLSALRTETVYNDGNAAASGAAVLLQLTSRS